MVILFKALQVILALSTLVFIHELGHFLWAKIFGIRVDKFYLFFDIGGKALCRFRIGETEFGIGWLPLGGYCKISGMVDESMDMEQLKKEPQKWEYRSHPAWHRLLVVAGGILNNFIFAILAYCLILGIWGSAYISNEESAIYPDSLGEEMGFRKGDRILRMDDYVPENFAMLQADLVRRNVKYVTLLRSKDTLDLYIDHSMTGEILNDPLLFDLAVPFIVDSLSEDSPNLGAGLLHGDRLAGIDGTAVEYLQDVRPILDSLRGRTISATVLRDGVTLELPLQVDSVGRIGVVLTTPPVHRKTYSVLESVPAGWKLTWSTVGGYIRDLSLVARPETGAYKSMGSFVAIGEVMPETWNWYQFLNILALLSIALAVMNLLPIPGLDGGHILFTLFEMITGRKPSDRFLAAAQIVGFVIVIALMFLAFGNDIGRLLK